ncbi:MAG: hypothetical protein CVU39_03650 [Chloroflexi bacterium HGW-Chloroflexi-10]|nr:MAG: hypothetical protein CVU39_03650 [Chloroflexi bacterium HGW-Chloroflexi-10]
MDGNALFLKKESQVKSKHEAIIQIIQYIQKLFCCSFFLGRMKGNPNSNLEKAGENESCAVKDKFCTILFPSIDKFIHMINRKIQAKNKIPYVFFAIQKFPEVR